jgi:hypothetical protein
MALSIVVFPTAGLQPTLDINLLTLSQLLAAYFSQIPPGNNIEPFGFFTAFPIWGNPGPA